MIIFGTKASTIRKGQIVNVDCPNCKGITTMKYSIFAKYFHLYGIPVFPAKKISVAECNSCKHTFGYLDIELIDGIRRKIEREKEKNAWRYPIWMYSGIFVIAGLIGLGYYNSKRTEANSAVYIKNPKVGDVYYLHNSESRYSTARVDKVSRTDVYLTHNDYEKILSSDIEAIDKDSYYTTSKDTISILQLQELYKNKTIIEITRKE